MSLPALRPVGEGKVARSGLLGTPGLVHFLQQESSTHAFPASRERWRVRQRKLEKFPAHFSHAIGTALVPKGLLPRRQGTKEPSLVSQPPRLHGCARSRRLRARRIWPRLLLWRHWTFRRNDLRPSDQADGQHNHGLLS